MRKGYLGMHFAAIRSTSFNTTLYLFAFTLEGIKIVGTGVVVLMVEPDQWSQT